MCRYRVNQNNSSHLICCSENLAKSKYYVNYVNTLKSTTYQVRTFKSNQIFGTKQLKTNIDCKRTSSTKQMNRIQTI